MHISDWHVGASLYRCDRSSDHAAVLAETIAHARAARPDLIIHTGDVFDALLPGHRAMRVAIDALTSLAEVAPVIVLAGNHDHPRLFEVFSTLRASGGLTFVPRVLPPSRGGIVDVPVAGGERVRVAPVPFIHQNRFVDWFGDDRAVHATYADKLRAINRTLADGLLDGYDASRDVLVYAAHVHVAGALLGGSERRVHVTEEYATGPESLPAVSYAALGHIHKPQDVTGAVTAAYAGSPLALDFGERGEEKSIVLATCSPGRPAVLERLPLSGGRPLRVLRGSFEDVRAAAGSVGDAIVRVVVESEDPIDGLVDHVRSLLPEATIVEIVEQVASRRLEPAHAMGEALRERTLDELFDDYLAERGSKTAPAATVKALWTAVQDEHVAVEGLEELLTCALPEPGP
ncbi:exonuclease SbcCD subunit D [Solirubrobacter soli]|uniref:exonuclease SbcCD subunit D n=1 Tax=Solirubrobacter soli TaxID=363832 RepID=UPI00146A66ED|nr:exonuclease SbcCD subunit D C-terminal domain-containing protein [Solirubrobacter soli]